MRRIPIAVAVVLLLTLLWVSPAAATGDGPRVIPPAGHPHGASYAVWSARWWKWAYQTPVHGSDGQVTPLLVPDRADGLSAAVDCRYGQTGKVWFLGGTYLPVFPGGSSTPSFTANRSCSIPAGITLFFPVLNSEWDDLNVVGQPPQTLTEAQLRALAAGDMNSVTDVSARLDGRLVRSLTGPDTGYRVTSPVFRYTLPADNLPTAAFGASFAGPVPYPPGAVADGIFLMVAPMQPGPHVLHWQGNAAPPEGGPFAQNITYHINVRPTGDD